MKGKFLSFFPRLPISLDTPSSIIIFYQWGQSYWVVFTITLFSQVIKHFLVPQTPLSLMDYVELPNPRAGLAYLPILSHTSSTLTLMLPMFTTGSRLRDPSSNARFEERDHA